MTTYDLGDTVPLSVNVTNSAGVAVDCSTMTLTLTLPDGTTSDIGLTNTVVGEYYADYVPAQYGHYQAVFLGTVPAVSYREDFWVGAQRFYASLTDLKSYLGISESDETDDLELSWALEAAQGAVNRHTGRSFHRDNTATARLFDRCTPDGLLLIDDVASTTDLAVGTSNGDGTYTTLASTSWQPRPLNSLTRGWPITSIQTFGYTSGQDVYAPFQVTAKWGWPALPAEVTQATLILAARLFKRRNSPEGVAGFGDLGVVRVTSQDADVARLLAPYTKPGMA